MTWSNERRPESTAAIRLLIPSLQCDLALVLSGGGARGAYQVGFLRVLAREFPDVLPGILTGVSAGGINAAYLAARQEPFAERVEELAEVWSGLHIDDVFRVDVRDLASRLVRWGGRLVSGGRTILPLVTKPCGHRAVSGACSDGCCRPTAAPSRASGAAWPTVGCGPWR